MAQIGMALKTRRLNLDMTQAILAVKSGVSLATLQNIEAGRANPALGTMEAICGVLKLEVFVRPIRDLPALSGLLSFGLPLLGAPAATVAKVRPTSMSLIAALNTGGGLMHGLRTGSREEKALASFLWALRDHYPSVWRKLNARTRSWLGELDDDAFSIQLRRLSLRRLSGYL